MVDVKKILVVIALVGLVHSQAATQLSRSSFYGEDSKSFTRVFKVNTKDCTTPRNTAGTCVHLSQCPILLSIIKSSPLNPDLKTHLQEYICGFDGTNPKVCCESDTTSCLCPDKSPGVCVPLSRCSSLFSLLETKPLLSDVTVDYLRKRECNYGKEGRVCCPLLEKKKESNVDERRERLPLPGECGVQEIEDKIFGGQITDLSEYPWMVLLEYGEYDSPKLMCGGSLISPRFVLTAAHCVMGPDVIRAGNLQRVRLGEYDTNNSTDCVAKLKFRDCSDPIQRIEIERIIPHEGFNLRNRDRSHDIALIQLKRPVKYTDFIRPICLPPPNFELPASYYVAGWGRTKNASNSPVKLHLKLPHFDFRSCAAMYAALRFPVHLGPSQICAGGEIDKDSCTGDSGGPLMAPKKDSKLGPVWYQHGVVSFGPIPCGQSQPGVYTNVERYMEWVRKIVTNTRI